MLSFLRKSLLPAVVAAGLITGFSTIPFARAEDKPAAAAEVKKGSVTGTVLDKDGKPVKDAEVALYKPQAGGPGGRGGPGGAGGGANRPNRGGGNAGNGAVNQATDDPKPAEPAPAPGRGNRQRPEPIAKATTDADGKFTIKDVPVGDYAVMVRTDKGMARERVTVKADEATTVSLKLQDRPARGGGGAGAAGGNRPNRPNRAGGSGQ